MSRLFSLAILVAPALAHADPRAAHAQGTWLELDLDSNLAFSSDSADTIDLPQQRLALGVQFESIAVGIEGGFVHPPDSPWRVELGPAARFTVAATETRDTELVFDATGLVSVGLTTKDMQDGGPTLYTFQTGLEVRHWLDPHFAVGGGVLAHLTTGSQSDALVMRSATDFGIGGTIRVSSVF
jgi:hypothetical protein